MQIALELKELSLKDAHNRDAYEEAGLHLVNDGVAWLLVNVDDSGIHTLHLQNKDIIKQYENLGRSKAARDIHSITENRLNYIIELLERQEVKPLAVQSINTEIDMDKITKLVQSINAPFMNMVNKED